MGTGTNQIATEKDLYYSGFTMFASSGISGSVGVTYNDLQKIKDSEFVDSVPETPVSSIYPDTQKDSFTIPNIQPQTWLTPIVITQWDVSSLSGRDSVKLVDGRDGLFQISVLNNGGGTLKVYLYLTFDGETPLAGQTTSSTNIKYVKTTTINSLGSSTINSCIHNALGSLTTSAFKGKKTCEWLIFVTNTSPIGGSSTTATITQYIPQTSPYATITTPDSNKLVKYQDVGGKDKPVKVTWTVKISEGVTIGGTSANKLVFEYQQMSSDGNTAHYDSVELGSVTLNNGNNISGSAEGTISIDINPISIKKNINRTDPVYGSWLNIYCGETRKKQTWTYKLRETSPTNGKSGTWESSFKDDNLYDIRNVSNQFGDVQVCVGDGYDVSYENFRAGNPPSYSDEQFLKDIKKYNGIEFYIK